MNWQSGAKQPHGASAQDHGEKGKEKISVVCSFMEPFVVSIEILNIEEIKSMIFIPFDPSIVPSSSTDGLFFFPLVKEFVC